MLVRLDYTTPKQLDVYQASIDSNQTIDNNTLIELDLVKKLVKMLNTKLDSISNPLITLWFVSKADMK